MAEHAPEDERSWDALYEDKPRVWSGNPNPQLVAEAGSLQPGRALDLGCGEGADAVWLAGQGWQVTAVDISAVALDRAARHAADRGLTDEITWVHQDLTVWTPPQEYDLISGQFFHLPQEQRDAVIRTAAAAVRPGGTLLLVGHHPDDAHAQSGHRPHLERLFRPEEMIGCLVPSADVWRVDVSEARRRPFTAEDGTEVALVDSVFRATRT